VKLEFDGIESKGVCDIIERNRSGFICVFIEKAIELFDLELLHKV
jgi:hypothetical protein